MRVKLAFLHEAIIICGSTENTLNPLRTPGIQGMQWVPGFLLVHADKIHAIPAANVKDSIVELDEKDQTVTKKPGRATKETPVGH